MVGLPMRTGRRAETRRRVIPWASSLGVGHRVTTLPHKKGHCYRNLNHFNDTAQNGEFTAGTVVTLLG